MKLDEDHVECGFASTVVVVRVVGFGFVVDGRGVAGLLERAKRGGKEDEPWVGGFLQEVQEHVCDDDGAHGVDRQVLTYLLSRVLGWVGDAAVVDKAVEVTVFLFDVFGCCLDGCIIRDINRDSFDGALDVRESLEGLDGFSTIFGNTAANEDMIGIRGEDEILGSLKADAFVGTCRVSAIELWKGID